MMRRDGVWHLAPAYDLTYTVDPRSIALHPFHCLPLGGKQYGVSTQDLCSFGEAFDIKSPDLIIERIAGALVKFRSIGERNGISTGWLDRIEANISKNLPWDFASRIEPVSAEPVREYTTASGHTVSDIRIEESQRGDVKMLATVDGIPRRYIFGRKTQMAAELLDTGLLRIDPEYRKRLAEFYIVSRLEAAEAESPEGKKRRNL